MFSTLSMTKIIILTPSQTTNFRLFQLYEFTDDNFKFDENGRKFSKQVENTVVKGEIKLVLQTRKNQGLFGRG